MASGKESVVKVTNSEEKKKALDAAIAKLEKDFGKGAVMKLGESGAHVSVETVPTGCLSLDLALGLGGVPKGRVIEVYGPESSGKTTVALHMISEVQKRGGIAGFIDAEHALDPVYAKNIGVDYIFRSRTAEIRHLRLRRRWCVPVRLILSLLTLLRHLFQSRRLKEIWETAM